MFKNNRSVAYRPFLLLGTTSLLSYDITHTLYTQQPKTFFPSHTETYTFVPYTGATIILSSKYNETQLPTVFIFPYFNKIINPHVASDPHLVSEALSITTHKFLPRAKKNFLTETPPKTKKTRSNMPLS